MGGNLLMGKENGVMEIRNVIFLLWGYLVVIKYDPYLFLHLFTNLSPSIHPLLRNERVCPLL